MIARLFLQILFAVSLAAVAVLSLVPPAAEPSISFLSDKLQHVSAYGWLALVGSTAVVFRSGRLAVIVFLPAFGVIIELLQYLVPDRTPEVADALANLVGTLLGAGLYRLLEKFWLAWRTPAT